MKPIESEPPEWEEDDSAMAAIIEERWRHRIGHECGHTIGALAQGHCPEAIRIGQLENKADGKIHHGLTVNGALPAEASAEARAMVLLAGMVAETLIFGSHHNGGDRDLEMVKPLVEEILVRDGESRSASQIRDHLITETTKLLEAHKESLDLLYSEAVERAQRDHGFSALEQPGFAVELLSREMLQYCWDHSKRKRD